MKAMSDLSQLKLTGDRQVLDKQLKCLVNSLGKAEAVLERWSCFLQPLENHEDSQQILRQTHTTHVLALTPLKSKIHLATPTLVWAVSQYQHLLERHTALI